MNTPNVGWNANPSNGSVWTSSAYNGMGLRVQKNDGTGNFGYLTDGSSPGSPVLSDGAAVYTDGMSERRGGVSKFYDGDLLGSVGSITDSSGQSVTDISIFDAFGNTIAHSGSTPTPFGYAGRQGYQTDANSGLMLLGNRFYDSSIGRFLSRDPAGEGDNWYAYCDNNPVSNSDPLGLDDTFTDASGTQHSVNDQGVDQLTYKDGTKATLSGGVISQDTGSSPVTVHYGSGQGSGSGGGSGLFSMGGAPSPGAAMSDVHSAAKRIHSQSLNPFSIASRPADYQAFNFGVNYVQAWGWGWNGQFIWSQQHLYFGAGPSFGIPGPSASIIDGWLLTPNAPTASQLDGYLDGPSINGSAGGFPLFPVGGGFTYSPNDITHWSGGQMGAEFGLFKNLQAGINGTYDVKLF